MPARDQAAHLTGIIQNLRTSVLEADHCLAGVTPLVAESIQFAWWHLDGPLERHVLGKSLGFHGFPGSLLLCPKDLQLRTNLFVALCFCIRALFGEGQGEVAVLVSLLFAKEGSA